MLQNPKHILTRHGWQFHNIGKVPATQLLMCHRGLSSNIHAAGKRPDSFIYVS